MGDKRIICAHCTKRIASADDLMVVAFFGLVLRPYHTACYGEREKSLTYQWFTESYPVNHAPGNWAAVTGLIGSVVAFAIVLSQTSRVGWAVLIFLLGLWPAVLRLISFLRFERPLIMGERDSSWSEPPEGMQQ